MNADIMANSLHHTLPIRPNRLAVDVSWYAVPATPVPDTASHTYGRIQGKKERVGDMSINAVEENATYIVVVGWRVDSAHDSLDDFTYYNERLLYLSLDMGNCQTPLKALHDKTAHETTSIGNPNWIEVGIHAVQPDD